jgi:hypothetical protein
MAAIEPMGDGGKERGQMASGRQRRKESANHRPEIHSLLPVPGWSF